MSDLSKINLFAWENYVVGYGQIIHGLGYVEVVDKNFPEVDGETGWMVFAVSERGEEPFFYKVEGIFNSYGQGCYWSNSFKKVTMQVKTIVEYI